MYYFTEVYFILCAAYYPCGHMQTSFNTVVGRSIPLKPFLKNILRTIQTKPLNPYSYIINSLNSSLLIHPLHNDPTLRQFPFHAFVPFTV